MKLYNQWPKYIQESFCYFEFQELKIYLLLSPNVTSVDVLLASKGGDLCFAASRAALEGHSHLLRQALQQLVPTPREEQVVRHQAEAARAWAAHLSAPAVEVLQPRGRWPPALGLQEHTAQRPPVSSVPLRRTEQARKALHLQLSEVPQAVAIGVHPPSPIAPQQLIAEPILVRS